MNICEKLELLNKYAWTNTDISKYLQVSISRIPKIRQVIINEYDGEYEINRKLTKRDSILTYKGTTLEKEISQINIYLDLKNKIRLQEEEDV